MFLFLSSNNSFYGHIYMLFKYCWDQLEYWEKTWWLKQTCCLSDSSEKPSDKADVKNSQKSKIIITF